MFKSWKKLKEGINGTKEKAETAIEKTSANVNEAIQKTNELLNVSSENIEFAVGILCGVAAVRIVQGITKTVANVKLIKVLDTTNEMLKYAKWNGGNRK